MFDDGREGSISMLTRSRFSPSPFAFALAVAALIGGITIVERCGLS
jgi:hypothetical protein